MIGPLLSGFLNTLVYPVTITAFGLIGNAYILGNQIKDVRDELANRIDAVQKDLGAEIREIKSDVKGLAARQTEMELADMSLAERFFKNCGEKK